MILCDIDLSVLLISFSFIFTFFSLLFKCCQSRVFLDNEEERKLNFGTHQEKETHLFVSPQSRVFLDNDYRAKKQSTAGKKFNLKGEIKNR